MEAVIIITLILSATVLAIQIYMIATRKKDNGKLYIDERDKQEITNSFSSNAKAISEVLHTSVENMSGAVKTNLENMSGKIKDNGELTDRRLESFEAKLDQKLKDMQDALDKNIHNLQEGNEKKLTEIQRSVDEKLTRNSDDVAAKLKSNSELTDRRLEAIETKLDQKLKDMQDTLDKNIQTMQSNNEKKLSEIQATVDEKLTKTLNERFTETFKVLSDELERVSKTMGEMKNISSEVGTLSRMLSGVKTTGIFGEIQLGAIIDEILTPDQYVKNVVTNKAGRDPVEFAVKLPGGDEGEVLLPIDSKFPYTVYTDMQTAYDQNDFTEFEAKKKQLIATIKNMAKDIKEKYINPPKTTNFAVMFLPIEGLYAEIVKLGLLDELRNKYNITVAGPTTMAALLNSLQMGFQTLAIQKKSNEVWTVLGTVKKEFEKFNGIIESIQKKLNGASKDLDDLLGVRTRAIDRSLRNVTVTDDTAGMLDAPTED